MGISCLGGWVGVRNGNPLQYSCLGNPRDRGDWQAPVHGEKEAGTSQLCPRPSTVRVLSALAESRTITSPRAPGAALASACCPSRLISFHSHSGPRLDDMWYTQELLAPLNTEGEQPQRMLTLGSERIRECLCWYLSELENVKAGIWTNQRMLTLVSEWIREYQCWNLNKSENVNDGIWVNFSLSPPSLYQAHSEPARTRDEQSAK